MSSIDRQIGGNHYKQFKIQPMEYSRANKLQGEEAAIVKYVTRHAFKGGKQDLLKAIHLIEFIIEYDYPEESK